MRHQIAGQVCTELPSEAGQGAQSAYCKAIGLHVCASSCPHWGASRSCISVMAPSTSSHVHHIGARVLTTLNAHNSGQVAAHLPCCIQVTKDAPFCWAACLAVMFILYTTCSVPCRWNSSWAACSPSILSTPVTCKLIRGTVACDLFRALHAAPLAQCRYSNDICTQTSRSPKASTQTCFSPVGGSMAVPVPPLHQPSQHCPVPPP